MKILANDVGLPKHSIATLADGRGALCVEDDQEQIDRIDFKGGTSFTDYNCKLVMVRGDLLPRMTHSLQQPACATNSTTAGRVYVSTVQSTVRRYNR